MATRMENLEMMFVIIKTWPVPENDADEHPSKQDLALLIDLIADTGKEALENSPLQEHIRSCNKCYGIFFLTIGVESQLARTDNVTDAFTWLSNQPLPKVDPQYDLDAFPEHIPEEDIFSLAFACEKGGHQAIEILPEWLHMQSCLACYELLRGALGILKAQYTGVLPKWPEARESNPTA